MIKNCYTKNKDDQNIEKILPLIIAVIIIAIDVKIITHAKELPLLSGTWVLTIINVISLVLNIINGEMEVKIFLILATLAMSFLSNLTTLFITKRIFNNFIYIFAFIIVNFLISRLIVWLFTWPLLWIAINLP